MCANLRQNRVFVRFLCKRIYLTKSLFIVLRYNADKYAIVLA